MFRRAFDDDELDHTLATYRTEGWALLPAVASDTTLESLRARASDITSGRVSYPGLFFQPDAPSGRYEDLAFGQGWMGPDTPYRKIEKLELDPLFRAWLQNPLFERIVRRVLPGAVTMYRAVIFNKSPRTGSDLPWHQDAGRFWGLSRDPELQIWTALDDAPKVAGCVEVFPRSHLPGLATPLGGVVPKEKAAAADAESHALPVPVRAGDVMLLHNHLWHRSGPNTTDLPRRGFTVCYMDAATRCTRTKRAPREFVRVFESRVG
ncbi:MAG: phytanoyl-CoA dioxygenase family protein [Myxococcota bacterium]